MKQTAIDKAWKKYIKEAINNSKYSLSYYRPPLTTLLKNKADEIKYLIPLDYSKV